MDDDERGTTIRPLDDLLVIDCTTGISGPYCTKLFADAGASIVKVEPAGGDPLRRYAATGPVPDGEDGALFRFLNAGKQSIVADPASERVDALLAGADLLVEDTAPGVLDIAALRARHPHLVIVSITPFGRTGPWAGRPASDLTLQAESGALTFRGPRDRPPVQAGGRAAEVFGGIFAAPPALAAVLRAKTTGEGEHLDVSVHDVMAIAGSNHYQLIYELQGRPAIAGPVRMLDTPGIEQASDALVAFNTNAGHMFQMFLLLVERPDLMDDPKIAGLMHRMAMGAEWQKIIDDWVGTHTVREVIDAAVALRVPVAPVHDAASVRTDEHLAARGVFVTGPDGLVQPRPPYRVDGQTMGARTPAPRLGEHDAVVQPRLRPATGGQTSSAAPGATAHDAASPALPLAGLRVLDLTSWWVGALSTHTLAFLGADVIHVEGVAHPDGMRLTGSSFARTEDWWEWGHMFAAANTDKRGITLDLGTDDGRALLDRLVEWADVLVENFSPRVAESWGLTREAVLARNPRIVYQRMPAFGLDGPWRDRPAFAQTIEPMSTMASITGYPDRKPVSKGGIPDPTAGMHGSWAVLVGIAEQRRRGGRGVFVEAVMIEAALNACAQPALEHAAYGRTMTRMGNRSPHAAPQGVYACEGTEQWLAVSALDDTQWRALATVVGGDALATDLRYADLASRHAHHDELDALLSQWCATRDPAGAAALLCAHGVAAAEVWDCRLVEQHPNYVTRHTFETVEHPVLGRHHAPGLGMRIASVDRWVRGAAPTFGQHTAEVLHDVLGLDHTDIEQLAARGVIASRPRGL
jgi:crotonobetainyl-CoA:carnitine CoA-transferase CaiB-like acyl-CoA transferase